MLFFQKKAWRQSTLQQKRTRQKEVSRDLGA
ncbi:MAG: hypothetical protein GPOALKHO_000308 [Sodalis sp.]|nr:MAG: hypothetical protein GPOALKHO_000308 [Sodalis sp.]